MKDEVFPRHPSIPFMPYIWCELNPTESWSSMSKFFSLLPKIFHLRSLAVESVIVIKM